MHNDKLSDKPAPTSVVSGDNLSNERLHNLPDSKQQEGLAGAQKTVDHHLGALVIGDEAVAATPKPDAPATSKTPATFEPYQPTWQQKLANTYDNAVSAVENHYTNPYGSTWNGDWQDITSGAPIDRRLIDVFKAIYHGPKEEFEALHNGLSQQ